MLTPDSDSPIGDLLARLRASDAQSLFERIDELRSRLIKLILLFTVLFIGAFTAGRYIFLYLKIPLLAALPEGQRELHFTGPMEVFMAYMKVSFLLAALVVAPFVFYQGYQYLKPALPPQSRKQIVPYFFTSMGLFIAGVLFCYFLMLPAGLHYLIGMGGDQVTPTITVNEYTSLLMFALLGFGAVFQLPVALVIAEALGVVQLEQLTKHRKAIVIIILVVAAIVAPSPDPLSQCAMAIPMYLMFEAAVLVIKVKRRRRRALVPTGPTGGPK